MSLSRDLKTRSVKGILPATKEAKSKSLKLREQNTVSGFGFVSLLTRCCAYIVTVSTAIPRMHIGTHSILMSASQQWQCKGYESLCLTLVTTLQSHHPRSQSCWSQISMLFLVQEISTLEENQSKCSTIGP
jgi:hypothetical protein